MQLNDDDFALFQLPRQQRLDANDLQQRWKALQREVHPDRFVNQGAAAQRVAMQWAVRVNEAFQRLKDPVRRAAYLCELSGQPIEAENNTAMPGAFLMQQMEWREALDDAGSDPAAIDRLAAEVAQTKAQAEQRLAVDLDDRHDVAAAANGVRELMFIDRFANELRQRRLQLQLQSPT